MTIILTVTLFVKFILIIYMEDLKNPVYRTRESIDVSFHFCCFSAPWLSALSEMKVKASRTVFAIPWTAVCPAPLSVVFYRQEYWSELPFPSLGDLPEPGIEPRSPSLQADALTSEPPGKPSVVNLNQSPYRKTFISSSPPSLFISIGINASSGCHIL